MSKQINDINDDDLDDDYEIEINNLGLDSTIPYKLSNIVYHFENEVTNRLIYLFIAEIKDDAILCTPRFKNSKLWSFKQIEEKMIQFQQEALRLIENFPSSSYKDSLILMVNYVIERKK